MLYTLLACILVIITTIILYFKRQLTYWRTRNIPSIEPNFPFGNFKDVGKTVHWANRMKEIYTKFKGKELFCGIYFLTSPKILLIDLDLIKRITIKDFNNFADRGMYYHETADPLSAHMFNIEGEKWRIIRSKLSPTFTSGKMKMMFGTVLDITDNLTTLLTSYANNETIVDARDICARFTIDVIGSCAFGLDCNSLQTKNSELLEIAKQVFDFRLPMRQIKFMFQSNFISLARKLNFRLFDACIEEYFVRIIKETIAYRETNQVERNDFMNLLLQIQKHGKVTDEEGSEHVGTMTFNELAAQAFVFFFAGYETSSTTMNFCLYELAYNQDIQVKVRDEINRVVEKYDGKFTYEGIMEMEYLGQVINETLRKFSPVSTLFRCTLEDYKVPGTSHIIEKNTQVMIPVYSIHHDPDIYPNPMKFDPDRFTAENIKKRHPYSFLAFGEGPRNCIGLRFAILQVKLGIASIIKKFKFTVNTKTADPLEIDPTDLIFIMSAKGGIWFDVEKI